MTNPSNQHDASGKSGSQKLPAFTCADVEARLTDAVENTLPAAEAQALADHKITCARCRALYTQATQGHQWLQLLHDELLEPPPTLVSSILARTSGLAQTIPLPQPARRATQAAAPLAEMLSSPRPWKPVRFPILDTLRHAVRDPRLSLTAAMAFFSISLTLNLLGIHLSAFRPSNLTANHLRLTLTRQYVMANSSVVRYYENLRFVYEVESSVQQLRRAESSDNSSDSTQPAKSKSTDGSPNPSGSSNQDHSQPGREPFARTPSAPLLKSPTPQSAPQTPVRMSLGPTLDAALQSPAASVDAGAPEPAFETGVAAYKPLKNSHTNIVATETYVAMEAAFSSASVPATVSQMLISRPCASLPQTPGMQILRACAFERSAV